MRVAFKDKIFITVMPMLVSILVFLILVLFKIESSLTETEGIDNCKVMLGLWGTLLGFMITAISILLTVNDNRFIKMLKNTGHFKTILYSFSCCCINLSIAIVFSVVIIFAKVWNQILFNITVSLAVDTFLIIIICLYFLLSIISKSNMEIQ